MSLKVRFPKKQTKALILIASTRTAEHTLGQSLSSQELSLYYLFECYSNNLHQ